MDLIFVELWTKDQRSGDLDHLAISVRPSDVESLFAFVDDVADRIDDLEESNLSGEWTTHESVSLEGERSPTGSVWLASDPDGDLVLCCAREDQRGNSRSISVPWKSGDEDRLRELSETLS